MENTEKIKLGISACLLGQSVRYNGGHQLDHFLKETLGKYVDYLKEQTYLNPHQLHLQLRNHV